MTIKKPSAKPTLKMLTTGTAVCASLLLGACATNGSGERTQRGATSSDDKGALYGAIAGALIGSAVGNYMDQQQREIEEELAAEIDAEQIEIQRLQDETLQISLSSETSFDIDSAALQPAFYPALNRLGELMGKYDKTALHVIGHTDSTGSDEHNNTLSRSRAVSVATYVRDNGVDRRRLSVQGRGEFEPRASNDTIDGRRANRRVEIFIKPIIEGAEEQAFQPPA